VGNENSISSVGNNVCFNHFVNDYIAKHPSNFCAKNLCVLYRTQEINAGVWERCIGGK